MKILEESHSTKCSIQLEGTKMYHDFREVYWWSELKQEIAAFVSQCMTYQKVKAKYQRLAGPLQPFLIPEWK